ncbi:helicase [Aeromicrobium flavum]|uniref:Helicase n=1 Tax=Aeromicrobium flavum TaxID=416568 RepID=A0A512HVQ4_9ACTN|nr:DEAD/DEAH box helicase [Aeromicrobium flavum]GEO89533.1 helicase [Aeromicrobium flavum]
MSELLPSLAAGSIRDGLIDYLETTFSLADLPARTALNEFLEHSTDGIFKGPYVRLRLPFQPAGGGWRDSLGWHPADWGGFAPYSHQAAAYERLSSLNLGPDKPRPLPTLVTTGTGSGKTEAFLHPILDHVLRSKRDGVTGMKALLLYPMNALANDQAQRLADLITTDPALAGVTAGLYTGQEGPQRTKVTADGLITDRYIMRSSAPDILLTNYKMLDQMLLREADQKIWVDSAQSLQYLVLDEFHTYDGAQGTDVAMLLRRLGLALKSHGMTVGDGEADRPLGHIAPVATSATLGDRGDPASMLKFAETVFGESFGPDAVVSESRVDLDDWVGQASEEAFALNPREGAELVGAVSAALTGLGMDPAATPLAEAVLTAAFEDDLASYREARGTAGDLLRVHPLTAVLVEVCREATSLADVAAKAFPGIEVAVRERCVSAYLGAISHVRKTEGRSMPSVEVHLWIRELTRIDREAAMSPAFFWSDDGGAPLGTGQDEDPSSASGAVFPAIYCRHCGRSGWGVSLSPANSTDLDVRDEDIRRQHASGEGRFRALLLARAEGERALEVATTAGGASGAEIGVENLRWLHVAQRELLAAPPQGEAAQDGSVIPVLTHVSIEADDVSRKDHCPACQQRDGIRFLGSAIATQLSVALSTLFGSTNLDAAEKKTLVFTDSVQDAAHRAGFVQSRSHSLTVRSVLREAVGSAATSLDMLAERVIERAGDDAAHRYRVLPPDLAEKKEFAPFWQETTLKKVPQSVRKRVAKRLAFDAVLEFGLQSQFGRTLEMTSTVAVEVEAAPGLMTTAARQAVEDGGGEALLPVTVTDERAHAWVRGVLERMRSRGAIEHPWLHKLIVEDGNRHFIWRGRPRSEGMPAFPIGRTAPAYPRVGPATSVRESVLDSVTTPQSWYAQWAVRVLQVSPAEGATLSRLLLKRLAGHNILTATSNKAGAEVYAVPQTSVVIEPIQTPALEAGEHLLVCPTCQAQVPGSATVITQLDGAPCMVTRCSGLLKRSSGNPENFYRRFFSTHEVQRVIAREHTSLLDDDVRLEYENGFKGREDRPNAPNVLVATPTLEMGIDIGDLSTVMLASLPRSVASYLQRVGRAGRLTGSALDLAFVSGRGEQLPRLGDPLSMINGEVRPPATYLDADEILRRQYLASLADRQARSAGGVHPQFATGAIGSMEPGSYLHSIALDAEEDLLAGGTHLDTFLAAFPTLKEPARVMLRTFVTRGGDAELTSPLGERLLIASQKWRLEVETLGHRITAIEAEIPDLKRVAELPVASEDDKHAYRDAEASLRLAKKQRARLQGDYWIGVLEHAGIFPNYTLLDDAVTLDVGLSWLDPDTGNYETQDLSYSRNAALALREFAPGATFYAGGHQVKVDTVDLGDSGEAIRTWVLCPACGFVADVTDGTQAPSSCPRCSSAGIADLDQRFDVVELTRVSSTMRRDEAVIDDGREERIKERFDQVVLADVNPAGIAHQWYIKDYGFGVKHVRDLVIRWLNLGRMSGHGSSRFLGGHDVNAELFRICSECGQLDSGARSNSKYEHRPWCRLRNASEEDTRRIALSRTLVTEGLLMRLPPMISLGSNFALPSLAAAVKLGLREHIGGAPDHLALEVVVDPSPDDPDLNADGLLLHDLVPGGTGYLAELADPATLRAILFRAYVLLRDCQCSGSERLACHQCLLPFAGPGQDRLVSRSEAHRLLHEILHGGTQTDAEPDKAAGWEITEVAVQSFDPESKMEQKFRAVLKQRLSTLGAHIKEIPGNLGTTMEITIGGGRKWRLDPQVTLLGSKPDFLLICNDPSVPRMAIFCDGWRYHASPLHNRLSDDAAKRAILRDDGFFVFGMSWADLEESTPSGPNWFDRDAIGPIMGGAGINLKPALFDLLSGSVMDLLMGWIQTPDPEGMRAIGDAMPFVIAARAQEKGGTGQRSDLMAIAGGLLDGQALGQGDVPVWAWRDDTLVVLSRWNPKSSATEITVTLDDRDQVIGHQHKAAWQEWLRFSNLVGLRTVGTKVTVASLLTTTATPTVDTTAEAGRSTDFRWDPVIGLAADEEREFLVALSRTSVPVPDLEVEIDGVPLGPSWPDRKVTVAVDLSDDERTMLADLGWDVVDMDIEAAVAALELGGF